jgi:acetyltransferase-like isoleucine patch superfamily enzyme
MNPIRALIRSLLSKLNYRHAKIAWGACLERESKIGAGVFLGSEAEVVACQLGDNVHIGAFSRLIESSLESNTKIYEHCDLTNVSMGSYSFIAERSTLSETSIGRFCSIGPQAIIGSGDHPTDWISTSPVFYSRQKQCGITFATKTYFPEKKAITIGNDTWIGARVFIRDGISIGNGAIIGAGAAVINDIPDYALVAGCPAKLIRFRFTHEEINRLVASQWWNMDADILSQHQSAFRQSDPEELLSILSR